MAPKKRRKKDIDDVSEPKQPKQPKRRKTDAKKDANKDAQEDAVDKPERKVPKWKKADNKAEKQTGSSPLPTPKLTSKTTARRKKVDTVVEKQADSSLLLTTSKPISKVAARPNIFANPQPLQTSRQTKQSYPSPAMSREGEPAMLKLPTSREPMDVSQKLQDSVHSSAERVAHPLPDISDDVIHVKRARPLDSLPSPSLRGAPHPSSSVHLAMAVENGLHHGSHPVSARENSQHTASTASSERPILHEASRLLPSDSPYHIPHQTPNNDQRPSSRGPVLPVAHVSDVFKPEPTPKNLDNGPERSLGFVPRVASNWPPRPLPEAHPLPQQRKSQSSLPKGALQPLAREPNLPVLPSNGRLESSGGLPTINGPELGSSPPHISQWRRHHSSPMRVPPRPSPMKPSQSNPGRNAFSSPSATQPLRHPLPPRPDFLPPRPSVQNSVKVQRDVLHTPSRQVTAQGTHGAQGPEPHSAPWHFYPTGFPSHPVMRSPAGLILTPPQYPPAFPSMGIASPANVSGWPVNHMAWPPNGQSMRYNPHPQMILSQSSPSPAGGPPPWRQNNRVASSTRPQHHYGFNPRG